MVRFYLKMPKKESWSNDCGTDSREASDQGHIVLSYGFMSGWHRSGRLLALRVQRCLDSATAFGCADWLLLVPAAEGDSLCRWR